MNRIYRVVWSRVTQQWVVVSEHTRAMKSGSSRRNRGLKLLSLSLLLGSICTGAIAAPEGGVVVSGTGSIAQSGTTTTVNQQSPNLSLNWNSFNVATDETVNFNQPNSQAVAVNRVLGRGQASEIQGRLNANGQVFLVNPDGVVFGRSAVVNVGGIVASTLDTTDGPLSGGRRQFSGTGTGSVVNKGRITTPSGGYVAFIGHTVSNQGSITTPKGTTALAGGSQVTVQFADNRLLGVTVDNSKLNALAENKQLIKADGGQVIMTAGARDSLLSSAVNNSGIVEAQTLDNLTGNITLLGGMQAGTTTVTGTLDASAPNGGDGGSIETSAAHVNLASDARITTQAPRGQSGRLIVDPQDYTIAASGGDISGAQLNTLLNSNNILISSTQGKNAGNGDLNVNDAITWNNSNSLTLSAVRDVNFNNGGVVTNTGGGKLNVRADELSGGVGTVKMNGGSINITGTGGAVNFYYNPASFTAPDSFSGPAISAPDFTAYMLVNTPTQLQNINTNLSGNYALGRDLDLSSISNFAPVAPGNGVADNFLGKFDGLNHTLSNLTQTTTAGTIRYGLFGAIDRAGSVSNLQLRNVNISVEAGNSSPIIGTLSGFNAGRISNVASSGSVLLRGFRGTSGGLVGANFSSGWIRNSTSAVNVSGAAMVGGLAGTSSGAITHSSASGSVMAYTTSGGLIGQASGTLSDVNATGAVTSSNGQAGGLIGVQGGGLSVARASASGAVTAPMKGGLIGININSSFTDSVWNTQTTGVTNANPIGTTVAATGLTSAQMQNTASFPGWDFTNTWRMGAAGPELRNAGPATPAPSFYPLTLQELTARDKRYDGTTAATVTGTLAGIIPSDSVSLTALTGNFVTPQAGNNIQVNVTGTLGGAQAGRYVVTPATTFASITQAILRLIATATGIDKVYDGTTTARVMLGAQGLEAGDAVDLHYAGATFADKNVGSNIAVHVNGITLEGADAGNYSLDNTTADTVASITPRTLSVTATADDKVYDGTTDVSGVTLAAGNLVDGDSVTLESGGAAFESANAGLRRVNISDLQLAGADSRNYQLTGPVQAEATITPRGLVISATARDKVYDGTDRATVDELSAFGVLEQDSGNVTVGNTDARFASASADSTPQAVTVSGLSLGGSAGGNYSILNSGEAAYTSASIMQRNITVSATGTDKMYDGTTAAQVTLASQDVLEQDAATVRLDADEATFASVHAASTPQTVTVRGLGLSGTGSGNYRIANAGNQTTTQATISPLDVLVTATGGSKVYDGESDAPVTLSVSGLLGSDSVRASSVSLFSNPNAGSGKLITVSNLQLEGDNATDYRIANPGNGTVAFGTITPRPVTISALGNSKVYDGTTVGSATLSGLGLLQRDSASLTLGYLTATLASKNVGTWNTLVSGLRLSGSSAGNYSLSNASALTQSTITPRQLAIQATAQNRQYDGTVNAPVVLSSRDILSGDTLTLGSSSSTFASRNASLLPQLVTVSGLSLSGQDAGNYRIANAGNRTFSTARITPRGITVNATGRDKVYDGTSSASVILSSSDILQGDSISLGSTDARFDTKNVGTGKTITVSGLSATGISAGNYSIVNTDARTTTTASISGRIVEVAATGGSRVYDGSLLAPVMLSSNGLLSDDQVTFTAGSALFDNKNVGSHKAVSVTGIAASGADAGNYLFNTSAATEGAITPRSLTVSATGEDKVYDGTTVANVTLSSDALSGDSLVPDSAGATFDTKNVGTDKTVTVSGIRISGLDAGNYTLSNPGQLATTTASITPRALSVSATGLNKEYDGTLTGTVHLSSSGILWGDQVGFTGNALFASKDVGVGKAVTVSDIRTTGLDGGNYLLSGNSVTTVASIAPRVLQVMANASNKVYDATTAANVALTIGNLVAGDSLTLDKRSATFVDKNVGSSKTVTVTGLTKAGADAGNYRLDSTTVRAVADITPRDLTVTAQGIDKVYDGTRRAQVTLSGNGVLSGDRVSFASSGATFDDKNVGNDKEVTVSGLSTRGTDARNYSLTNLTATTRASITPRALNVIAKALNKVYDATTAASIRLTASGLLAGDQVSLSAMDARFADKNVANNKMVTVSGLGLGGADAQNYRLTNTNSQATATASITPRMLTVSATGENKVYDATTAARVTLVTDGVLGDDAVSVGSSNANFSNKAAGRAKTVTAGGLFITGPDAGNYRLNRTTATTSADITPRFITVTAQGSDKVYDGSVNDRVLLVSGDVLAGDRVSFSSSSATFADKNVGNDKVVTVLGLSKSGADAGNYALSNASATTRASITPRSLDVVARGIDKVYDGTASATVLLTAGGVLSGDALFFRAESALFEDAQVGANKAVNVSGISAGGGDAGNYRLNNTTAVTRAAIKAP